MSHRIVLVSQGRSSRQTAGHDLPPWWLSGYEAENFSTERFRALLDLARDAFVETDGAGVVTEWNRQAELLFGWSREEVIGRPIGAFLVPARYVEKMADALRQVRRDGGAERTSPRRLWFTHREGHELHVTVTSYVLGAGDDLRIGGFVQEVDDEGTAEAALAHAYLHDALTGLPNRTLFTYRLAYALATSRRAPGSVAALVLDLDRFKAVNEALGHEVGDELLVAVATRLVAVAEADRPAAAATPELVARLGGDEFLALFHGPDAEKDALEFSERALEALGIPLSIAGEEIFVSASVGVASTKRGGADEPTRLLSNADAAMYQAKRRGGGRVEVFGDALRVHVLDRMNTEHALHRALERGELELLYQPVVSLEDSRVVSSEVLLRWDHPQHGLVCPDRFIPVAEESGLIIPIGTWVLEEACRQVATWRCGAWSGPGAAVEVNLSPRQIEHPDVVAVVERALARSGVEADRLTLEITESALMHDARSVLRVLHALKELGVSLAIDDFGTGYSSLGYLQRFPLDVLKIDKRFVAGLVDAGGPEIVGAVVGLAHALGLEVIAEGVETERQAAELHRLGCDFAQGYLFSRPLKSEELIDCFGRGGQSPAGRLLDTGVAGGVLRVVAGASA
ncbi:MAG TPA: EAL domain-containing protein [Acidimicrobiales bacterium]|nr:EAL domain-containing protein [Acidimicrobiales bacterium]